MNKQLPDEEYNRMINKLESALRPISPRPEYRHYLHERLVDMPVRENRRERRTSSVLVILAAVGLTGMVVLLVTLIKAMAVGSRRRYSNI